MGRFSHDGADTDWVSISIERSAPCMLHAGILYRDTNRRLFKLHFGGHWYLGNDRYANDAACSIPDIDAGQPDKADGEWIAGYCEKVAASTRNNKIPYNLKYDEEVSFDDATGDISLGPTSTGLSCATFVLAVLRSSGNKLIDAVRWPQAIGDDKAGQIRFVNMMLDSKNPGAQRQGRIINAEIGTPRIRPDHVAGACLEPHSTWPIRYAICDRNAANVVAELDRVS